jgi:hypothetical protein
MPVGISDLLGMCEVRGLGQPRASRPSTSKTDRQREDRHCDLPRENKHAAPAMHGRTGPLCCSRRGCGISKCASRKHHHHCPPEKTPRETTLRGFDTPHPVTRDSKRPFTYPTSNTCSQIGVSLGLSDSVSDDRAPRNPTAFRLGRGKGRRSECSTNPSRQASRRGLRNPTRHAETRGV